MIFSIDFQHVTTFFFLRTKKKERERKKERKRDKGFCTAECLGAYLHESTKRFDGRKSPALTDGTMVSCWYATEVTPGNAHPLWAHPGSKRVKLAHAS